MQQQSNPFIFRLIDFLNAVFRERVAPISRIDSRMKEFKESPESTDRSYWQSRQYWRMEYERACKEQLAHYGRTTATVAGKKILEIGCGLGGVI